jgi:hypothetical protein
MLRSSLHDSNILGLENLISLTDPIKTSPVVALGVSKCIALGDCKYDVREEIRLLTERDVFAAGMEPEDASSRHADHLRHLALSVFANSLDMCHRDGSLASAVSEQRWYVEQLIPSLVDELKHAESSTCAAHQAACCLSELVECSEKARRLVLNSGVETLEEARNFGEKRHALLAEETTRSLKALGKLC